MERTSPVVATIVVIPCYNEARRLDVEALRRFADSHSNVYLVLVDDGSTDETAGILRDLAQNRSDEFSALSLPRNMGKAEAVRRGILLALERAPSFVACWDADL